MIATFLAALLMQSMTVRTPPGVTPPPRPCLPNAPLPGPLRAWQYARPLSEGFVVGRTVDLPAVPVANVRLAVQPTRPLTGSHVASGSFTVAAAGTYRVAAGGAETAIRPLWLDIAGADRKPLTSVAHNHGGPCSSITKVVEFRLKPGRYTFLATGLTSAAPVRVLIVAKR